MRVTAWTAMLTILAVLCAAAPHVASAALPPPKQPWAARGAHSNDFASRAKRTMSAKPGTNAVPRLPGGQKSDPHFGVAEFCIGSGEGEVAQCGDAAAAREGRALHRGDQRFGKTPDAAEHFCHAARIFLIFLRGLPGDGREHFEVHARAEGFACAA